MKLGDEVFQKELANLEDRIKYNGYDNFLFRFKNLVNDYDRIVSDDIIDYAKKKLYAYETVKRDTMSADFSGEEEPKIKEKRYEHSGEYHHGYRQHKY